MSSRVRGLLQSQWPREARRIDVMLLRAGAIAAVLVLLAFTGSATVRESLAMMGGNNRLGRWSVQTLLMIQAGFGIGLVSRLAGDGVGDRKSGLLDLLSLTGCTPREWLLARLLVMAPSALSVWIVHLPFLYLAVSLGGVTWEQIFLAEGLLASSLAMLLAIGMSRAHDATSRAGIRNVWGILIAMEAALGLPAVLASSLGGFGVLVPGVVEDWLMFLSGCGTRRCIQSVLRNGATTPQILAAVAIPLGIAGIAMLVWLQRLYGESTERPVSDEPAPLPATAQQTSSASSPIAPRPVGGKRPSRRSWDDALAWQAYAVFHNGARVVLQRSLFYIAAGVLLLALSSAAPRGWSDFALSLFLLLCGGAMFRGITRAGECLQQEIRESTLPTLVLTPHEPVELHDGWSRGTWQLLRPELVLFAVGLVASLARDPEYLAPAMLSVGLGILAAGPFFTLSPLLPYTVKGIVTGLLVFLGMALCVFPSVLAGIFLHPWLAPVVLAPLVFGWNRICRSLVASWLAERLQTII